MKKCLLPAIFLLSIHLSLCATEPSSTVTRISPQFNFDGMVSPGEWDHIAPVELTVQTPVFEGEPSEQTEIRMAYDETYIYLSGALFDSEPDKISANNKERDGGTASTEWFGFVIDSYNDNQNALGFFTTPTGSRFDAAIQNDGTGREPMSTSWNNFWDVKTVINDQGWFAEIRVPFSSLQFQAIDGKVTMGITMWRYIARHNEVHICPSISPDQGDMAMWRPSLNKEYVFEGIKQKKPFYITPYLLGGFNSINELNANETAYEKDETFIKNAGLDVKLGITNNFTLDLTANTDFAQVEADDQQVNLSRFSLFFPEKRLFFQERAGIFDFRLGRQNYLFYSRRIGIDDDGNAIPIIGGARLTGRTGDWDIGLINMQTQKFDALASNNYSVFRIKKQVLNDNSNVGLMFTNRINTDGNYNSVVGFDSRIRWLKDDFIDFKFAQAFSTDKENKPFTLDPSMLWFSMSRQSQEGFTYGSSFSYIGADFNPEIGFIDRENYTRWGIRLSYNFYADDESKLFRHGPQVRGVSYWDNYNGLYNNAFYALGYEWRWRNGIKIEARGILQYDDIQEEFEIADIATVPVGNYTYPGFRVQGESAQSKNLVTRGEFQIGQFYDGTRTTFRLSPEWNATSSLRFNFSYDFNIVDFPNRNQKFNTHVARLKALVMISTKFSISSFIQLNSLDNLYLGNIRLRYNPAEGNDLFIVFNSDLNADRLIEDPMLPRSNQSSLLVKYSYTFRL